MVRVIVIHSLSNGWKTKLSWSLVYCKLIERTRRLIRCIVDQLQRFELGFHLHTTYVCCNVMNNDENNEVKHEQWYITCYCIQRDLSALRLCRKCEVCMVTDVSAKPQFVNGVGKDFIDGQYRTRSTQWETDNNTDTYDCEYRGSRYCRWSAHFNMPVGKT